MGRNEHFSAKPMHLIWFIWIKLNDICNTRNLIQIKNKFKIRKITDVTRQNRLDYFLFGESWNFTKKCSIWAENYQPLFSHELWQFHLFLHIAEDGGLGTCSACPELAAQHGGRHTGPHMVQTELWQSPRGKLSLSWLIKLIASDSCRTGSWRTEVRKWWKVALIAMAISMVCFASTMRAGTMSGRTPEHRWQAAGRAQWGWKQRFTKQSLLPRSRLVSHQSQSHHCAVANAVSQGVLNPPLQGR